MLEAQSWHIQSTVFIILTEEENPVTNMCFGCFFVVFFFFFFLYSTAGGEYCVDLSVS